MSDWQHFEPCVCHASLSDGVPTHRYAVCRSRRDLRINGEARRLKVAHPQSVRSNRRRPSPSARR